MRARRLAGRLGAEVRRRLRQVAARAATRGMRAWLVGGVVRDLLLDQPLGDLDLAIEGDARSLARDLVRAGDATLVRESQDFGTATLRFPDAGLVDLAMARRESYRRPAALPTVEPGSLEQDLLRRDFTINSMAVSLDPRSFGALLDPTGGLADLERRRIRILHDGSFLDDPTRALRAVRFAVRLGFSLDPHTARRMREAAAAGVFERLSPVRLRRELELLFDEPRWSASARLLGRHGLWTVVIPDLAPKQPELAGLARLETAAARAKLAGAAAHLEPWVLVLAWIARELDDAARARLVARLRPNRHAAADLAESASRARAILNELRADESPAPSAVQRACAEHSPAAWLLALAEAPRGALSRALRRFVERDSRVRLDIDGRDLLRAGIAPGPAVAAGLRAALAARLDGSAPDRARQLRVALAAAGGA